MLTWDSVLQHASFSTFLCVFNQSVDYLSKNCLTKGILYTETRVYTVKDVSSISKKKTRKLFSNELNEISKQNKLIFVGGGNMAEGGLKV